MGDEFKWFMALMAAFVIVPMIGFGVSTYQVNNCRMELAKAGRAVEEIKELCK